MKKISCLSCILFFIAINASFCQINIIKINNITTLKQEFSFNTTGSLNKYFTLSISEDCTEDYKFIHIISTPIENFCRLYFSTKMLPGESAFDISATNDGTNEIYVPRTYFSSTKNKEFYLDCFCQPYCNFNISFELVENMHAKISVRLDFLTFDYEEYLIFFYKNETNIKNKLMVTASGGAKGHHGTRNNIKLALFYVEGQEHTTQIDIDSDTMLNGAGTTFPVNEGEGQYIAKLRAPINTYVNFMVRPIGTSYDLPIDGKAIYGYLQEDDIDIFNLTGFKESSKIIQVSIIVKGDLILKKSKNSMCGAQTENIEIKDEFSAYIFFTHEEISSGITHICIQGKNSYNQKYAYIMEVHDVTDQKTTNFMTEPLVNGYIYSDYLKRDEVKTYRHSKYLETGLTKYNCKLIEGNIKVALVKCSTFPSCKIDKSIINGQAPHSSYISTPLTSIDNYYTTNVNKDLETNAYGPVQYLLSVLCLTNSCEYEVSFSDEEDSLIIREDSRIAHFISPGSTNYYHFKISDLDNAKKVFVYLRTISGDSNIDVFDDATERKRYYIENTKILEFYEYEYTGLYSLNVTGRIGSFYLLSYSVIRNNETEDDKIFDIGLGISFIDGIKYGNSKKRFKMFVDKAKGDILKYVATFKSINCNINVKYDNQEVNSINGIFQHEIEVKTSEFEGNYLNYQVNLISFDDDSSYDNKFCLFHITAQEVSSNMESIVSEGTNIEFALTPKTTDMGFIYPHSAGDSDILIKYTLENSYLVRMTLKINNTMQTEISFSRSSSRVIPAKDIRNFCPDKNEVCGINIHFISSETSMQSTIPMSFLIKSKDNTPAILVKNKIQVDLVAENNIQYYLVDINPNDKGEVMLNFKKGSGIMFAKMVGKDADPEDNPNWEYRVRLPKPDEKDDSVGEFDRYKNNIKYDASKLYKYGLPVCKNGCELYIGVISTDIIESGEIQNDYLEYSIYVRPELNTTSTNPDEHQKLINKVFIDLLANEYVTGYIESSSDIHYYLFDVQDDSDFIEIEFQSESCSLYINTGKTYPDPGNSKWEINSEISNTILTIKKEEVGEDNLKGVEFRMAVNSKKYDELLSMMYIFRIRMFKRSSKSIIEINGNLATVCSIKSENDYCDLVYPLSDFEFQQGNSLFVYAESDVINDINIYFNPIINYDFDKLNSEEMEQKLPRPGNSKKNTELQGVKNYIEITKEDLILNFDTKTFALISIKSNKPCIINIYTTMRENILNTTLNPYSKLLFQRKQNNTIYFKTKGDQAYNFYISCINGQANAYFESEKEYSSRKKLITGSGSLFSLALPSKKEDTLIVEPTSDLGIIFYIYENIHPEVRPMELIKFGYSGRIVYEKNVFIDFPIIYYMRIQDEDESINLNIHITSLETYFHPTAGLNYTDVFDIYGWIVDENMITSMMRSRRINPPNEEAVRGRYDKSLATAKLYFSSEQIKQKGKNIIKYLVISLNKNEFMDSYIRSMNTHISAIPFSNKLYSSPYNLYIAGNLLKDKSAPLCNYHRLRVGNQGDKYMQIELGILSSNVNYNIKDINNNQINYKEAMTLKNGKYKGIIELQNNNDLYLELCRPNIDIAHEASLNYIFKVKSDNKNDFTNYNLDSNKVTLTWNKTESGNQLNITIPKILNKEKTKAAPAMYFTRIYPKEVFDSKDRLSTISFISYYAFSTYMYRIFGNEEDSNVEPILITLNDYPGDKEYVITIIGVTNDEDKEEIFAYQIYDEHKQDEDKKEIEEDNSYTAILVVSFVIVCIIIAIFVYFIIRMLKQKKSLEEEINRASKVVKSYEIEPDEEPKEDSALKKEILI